MRLGLRPQRPSFHRSRSDLDAIRSLPDAGTTLDRSAGWSETSHHVFERKIVAGDVSLVLIRRARPLCGPPVLAGLFTFDLTCTQFAHAQQAGGAQMGIRLEQVAMTVRRTPDENAT
jgi:hypothetical protein